MDAVRHSNTVLFNGHSVTFDPREFFRRREGLYVWESFTTRIVAAAKSVTSVSAAVVAVFDLTGRMDDTTIRGELPAEHLFVEADHFCFCLADMLGRQRRGEPGILLTNGFPNLFYVCGVLDEVSVVRASLNPVGPEWNVYAYPLDNQQWRPDSRVFSRSCP